MSTNDPGQPRVIRFDEGAARPVATTVTEPRLDPTVDRPAETRAGPAVGAATSPRATVAETPPARPRPDRRPWLLAGAGAVLLGVLGGLWLNPGREDRRETADTEQVVAAAPAETVERESVTPATAGPAIAAATEPYRTPEAAAVERALKTVRADYASGGASAVAQASRGCFDRLARAPAFGELDYCLAYDAYGAALARRLAAGRPLPADSWFGGVEARGLRTASAVIGAQGDAAARLLDIRRLTVSVADANPAVTGAGQRATAEPRRPLEVAEAPSLPPARVVLRPEMAPAPVPRAAPRPFEAPEPRQAPPAPVQRAAVEPPPAASARPSFNCRYARSASERLVCADPVLAAADWRLHNVFERAMAESPSPRALRAEQDRWLAAREAAASDPRAVLQVYETRIDELAAAY